MRSDIEQIVDLLTQANPVLVTAVKNVLAEMVSESKANKYGRKERRNN